MIRVSPVVDGATGTVKVTVELQPKDEGFKPGAFVRVDIETDAKNDAILVPRRAIIEDEGETYVESGDEKSEQEDDQTIAPPG